MGLMGGSRCPLPRQVNRGCRPPLVMRTADPSQSQSGRTWLVSRFRPKATADPSTKGHRWPCPPDERPIHAVDLMPSLVQDAGRARNGFPPRRVPQLVPIRWAEGPTTVTEAGTRPDRGGGRLFCIRQLVSRLPRVWRRLLARRRLQRAWQHRPLALRPRGWEPGSPEGSHSVGAARRSG